MFQSIASTSWEDKEPQRVDKDSKGKLIKNDSKVAYNRSGDVVTGTIIRLKKSEWVLSDVRGNKNWWRLRFELEIRGDDGVISTIKNPNSFIII